MHGKPPEHQIYCGRGGFINFYTQTMHGARSIPCSENKLNNQPTLPMLSWAVTFLIIAIIAAVLGFGVIAGTAASIAKVLFLVFLVLFVVSLLMGRKPPVA